MTMQQKSILITGCSSGIGLEAAKTLANRGHQVIASCRKEQDVNRLLASGIDTVLMDLDNEHSITKAVAEILRKTEGRLDILINNAGYGQAGALEDVPREALRQQFETNVFGLMDLTRQIIPIMREQGHGRIINVSSVLGLIALPFRGAYNASKYAVEGLTDTLRLELQSSGIKVICIEPGPITSRFRDNSIDTSLKKINMEKSVFHAQYQKMLTGFRAQKDQSFFTKGPEAVIKQFIHAVEAQKPKLKYPVTFPAHFFPFLKRILSTKMLDRVLTFISKKELG